jgi:hypothetical protein
MPISVFKRHCGGHDSDLKCCILIVPLWASSKMKIDEPVRTAR